MGEFMKGLIKDATAVLKMVLIVGIPMGILLFHVWHEYRIVNLGYQIADVTSEHRTILEDHKKLSIEAAVQGRTERIASVAREQFGLEQVRPHQVFTIRLLDSDHKSVANGVEHASLDY